MGFLKQRVTVALIGMVLFGGIGALMAMMPVLPHGMNTTSIAAQATASVVPATATSVGIATATATISQDVPTPTTAASPTTAVRPTPTKTLTPTPGQTTTLQGTISNIQNDDRQSFTLNLTAGGAVTVIVGGSTQYQGVSDFNGLRSGMAAKVTGFYSTSGRFNASVVQIGS